MREKEKGSAMVRMKQRVIATEKGKVIGMAIVRGFGKD